jgi:hypothetical protein
VTYLEILATLYVAIGAAHLVLSFKNLAIRRREGLYEKDMDTLMCEVKLWREKYIRAMGKVSRGE